MVEAICLPVNRHTAFAMTILNLSLRAVQKTRRGNLLAMTTCQQMAARLKASRHDNLFLHLPRSSCHSRSLKRFSAKPKCEPATSHTCGVVEAIPSQATLVFGLLRYARNDKNQDRHTALAMTILNLSLRAVQKARCGNLLAMTTCQQMAARLKASRHDNLFLHLPRSSCHSRSLKRFSAKPKCEPATSHTCGVVEAISLP